MGRERAGVVVTREADIEGHQLDAMRPVVEAARALYRELDRQQKDGEDDG